MSKLRKIRTFLILIKTLRERFSPYTPKSIWEDTANSQPNSLHKMKVVRCEKSHKLMKVDVLKVDSAKVWGILKGYKSVKLEETDTGMLKGYKMSIQLKENMQPSNFVLCRLSIHMLPFNSCGN